MPASTEVLLLEINKTQTLLNESIANKDDEAILYYTNKLDTLNKTLYSINQRLTESTSILKS